MSSNNMLFIIKNKKGFYEIYENLCIDIEFKPSKNTILNNFKIDSLIEAIKFVQDYMSKEIVEYGYHIHESCFEEKKHAKRKN